MNDFYSQTTEMMILNGVNGGNDSADEHYDTPWEFKNRAIAAALATSTKSSLESPNLQTTSKHPVQSTSANVNNSFGSRSGQSSSLSSSSQSQKSSPSQNGTLDSAGCAMPSIAANSTDFMQKQNQPRKRLSLDQQANGGQFLPVACTSIVPGTKMHDQSLSAVVAKSRNEHHTVTTNSKCVQTPNYVSGAGSCSRARFSFGTTAFTSGEPGPSPSNSGELFQVNSLCSSNSSKPRHSSHHQPNNRRNPHQQKQKSEQNTSTTVTTLLSPPGTASSPKTSSGPGTGPSLITITSSGMSAARRDHYPLVSVNPAAVMKSPTFAHPFYPLPSNGAANGSSDEAPQWQQQPSAKVAVTKGSTMSKVRHSKDNKQQHPQLDTEGIIHERLDRVEAETLLSPREVGVFLLRRRPVEGNLALSLRSSEGVLHIKLEFRDGCWILGEGPRFTTILSMVRAYRRTELPVRGAEHIRLGNQIRTTDINMLKQLPANNLYH